MSLVNCTFQGNAILGSDSNGAVILADAGDGGPDTKIRLDTVSFQSNEKPVLLADNRGADTAQAVFYGELPSDGAGTTCTYEGADEESAAPTCEPMTANSLALADAGFLTAESSWLVEVQQVRCLGLCKISVSL